VLKYEYINKEWIVSPVARRVYRFSASVSIALFVVFIAILIEGFPEISNVIIRTVLLVGAIGSGVTLVGMEVLFISL